jgi:hypothetical protein
MPDVRDFQRWAASAHGYYAFYRAQAGGVAATARNRDHYKQEAHLAAARREDFFKVSWRLRFGTPEPEAWA